MPALRNRLYRTRRRTNSSARTQGMARGEGARRIVGSPNERQQLTYLRAHELFEQRGRNDGHELGDWLQAESEVTQQKAKGVGA